MRNTAEDIKNYIEQNKNNCCSICKEEMFKGVDGRSFTYLDCNTNNGRTKGHAFHGQCLAGYLTRQSTDYF